MNFSSYEIMCYQFDNLSNWLLIMDIKILIGHNCPQFIKSENENILEFDKHDTNRYIPLLFFPYSIKSNCPLNLSKEAKILTYLVSLQKAMTRKSLNMAIKFLSRGDIKVTKNLLSFSCHRT